MLKKQKSNRNQPMFNPFKIIYKYRQKKYQKCKYGQWQENQNNLYIKFINDNHLYFQTQLLRRSKAFFQVMSQYIKTRNPQQCKSHHQKMIKKYNNNFFRIEKHRQIQHPHYHGNALYNGQSEIILSQPLSDISIFLSINQVDKFSNYFTQSQQLYDLRNNQNSILVSQQIRQV